MKQHFYVKSPCRHQGKHIRFSFELRGKCLKTAKTQKTQQILKCKTALNPVLFSRVLGMPLWGALWKKKRLGILKHFVKFRGINLCRRLIFDKLAIKWPTKMVGSKVFYVSCFENGFSGSHNSRVAKLPPVQEIANELF